MERSSEGAIDMLDWRKASNCASGQCVEIAPAAGAVNVRDSESPEGPFLAYSGRQWGLFVEGLRRGRFDQRR